MVAPIVVGANRPSTTTDLVATVGGETISESLVDTCTSECLYSAMDAIELLDRGYAWTAARIAVVPASRHDAPTPCTLWNLRELLDHTIGALTLLTDAVVAAGAGIGDGAPATTAGVPGGRPLDSTPWDRAIAEVAARSRRAWEAPGVMDRVVDLPIGTLPAPVVASVTLLEVVTHGWDIGQASGEGAEIPDALALPVLEFARTPLVHENRGDNFAADLGIGDTPSERLVAFLGRKPL
jgi:uncharacterized protein (TIGR03086 family)